MQTRMDRTLRWIALLLCMSTLAACAGRIGGQSLAHVSSLELEGWRELRTADFALYSRGPRADLEALAQDLARYVAVVERLVQSQPPKKPARIVLVEDRAEKLFISSPSVGGYMAHTLSGFVGFMRGSTHDPSHRHLLLHEFSHYLNLRNRKLSYPSWYVEGFAEFLGPTRTRDDMMEVGSAPPNALHYLEYRQLEKEPIDLEEIFSFEKVGEWRYPPYFYQISWAVVHYLNASPERQKRLVAMLQHQDAGLDWRRAYASAFDESLEELASKIVRHAEMLRQGTPSAVLYLPLESLEVRGAFEIRQMPPVEVLQLLGGFAIREEIWGDTGESMALGEALFRRALDLDSNSALSHAGLAVALAGQARFADAKIQLEAFDSTNNPSTDAIVHAGNSIQRHALSLEAKQDEAQRNTLHASALDLFRRALAADEENAPAWAGLGLSQLETGDFESAKQSLQRAQTAGEWDATLTLARGRVEEKLGSKARATDFWNDVVRLGREEDAKKAIALLKKMNAEK